MSVYVLNQAKNTSLSYPVNTSGARAGKLWPTAYFQPAPGFMKQFYWKTATPIHLCTTCGYSDTATTEPSSSNRAWHARLKMLTIQPVTA